MLRFEASKKFDFLSEEFQDLFDSSEATAFQHPIWQSTMQDHIESLAGVTAKTLVMRCRDSGKLMGVLPLISRKVVGTHVLEYANLGLVDYAMPVLHPNLFKSMPDVRQLAYALDQTLGSYDVLRIKHMPTSNPLMLRLFPNSYMKKADFSSHAAQLEGDYETWRKQAISAKERKSRDRKRRALNKAGHWDMRALSDPYEVEQALEKLRSFREPRYRDREAKDYIQDQNAFRFYRKLAKVGVPAGFVTIFEFTLDDAVVSVQFGLSHNKRFSMLLPGIDYDKLSRFSPGLLINEDMIADRIANGFEVFDFTVGDEAYKLKFGTKASPIYTLWHGHSMLGNMSMSVAEAMNKSSMGKKIGQLLR